MLFVFYLFVNISLPGYFIDDMDIIYQNQSQFFFILILILIRAAS